MRASLVTFAIEGRRVGFTHVSTLGVLLSSLLSRHAVRGLFLYHLLRANKWLGDGGSACAFISSLGGSLQAFVHVQWETLYRRFMESPNFKPWFTTQRMEAVERIR